MIQYENLYVRRCVGSLMPRDAEDFEYAKRGLHDAGACLSFERLFWLASEAKAAGHKAGEMTWGGAEYSKLTTAPIKILHQTYRTGL